MNLISIPRDTMTPIEVFDKSGNSLGLTENHISLSYGYGDGRYGSLELTENAVSDLFYGVPIQGACAMSLDGISELVRSLGDVQVVVPNDSLEERYPEFKAGETVTITPDQCGNLPAEQRHLHQSDGHRQDGTSAGISECGGGTGDCGSFEAYKSV